jgi:antitoxin VapB
LALNIRDPEVHRLARAVADATGETMTDAVKHALRERLAAIADTGAAERERRFRAIMERGRRFRALPASDPRPLDEIVAYDENGLPR